MFKSTMLASILAAVVAATGIITVSANEQLTSTGSKQENNSALTLHATPVTGDTDIESLALMRLASASPKRYLVQNSGFLVNNAQPLAKRALLQGNKPSSSKLLRKANDIVGHAELQQQVRALKNEEEESGSEGEIVAFNVTLEREIANLEDLEVPPEGEAAADADWLVL